MGIALKQFMIASITPTDETAKAIDERSSMGAVGNLDNYMKFKTARAVGDAAQQEGGGAGAGLGLGAGIGMGAGMAGMLSQCDGNRRRSRKAAPAAAAAHNLSRKS